MAVFVIGSKKGAPCQAANASHSVLRAMHGGAGLEGASHDAVISGDARRNADELTLEAIARHEEEVDRLVLASPASQCSTVDSIAQCVRDVDGLVVLSPTSARSSVGILGEGVGRFAQLPPAARWRQSWASSRQCNTSAGCPTPIRPISWRDDPHVVDDGFMLPAVAIDSPTLKPRASGCQCDPFPMDDFMLPPAFTEDDVGMLVDPVDGAVNFGGNGGSVHAEDGFTLPMPAVSLELPLQELLAVLCGGT
mmetsp:Transcript_55571/g.154819  ORF Transcript_55571/g.154819 Transcript_55571/m.154819 type:complete len:251 (-) Transcript_55571:225-977(-)